MRVGICKGAVHGPVSGLDEAVVNYGELLRDRGHEVVLIIIYPPNPHDAYLERFASLGIHIEIVKPATTIAFGRIGRAVARRWPGKPGSAPPENPSAEEAQQAAFRLLSELRVDLVHLLEPHNHACAVLRAANSLGIPGLYQEPLIPRADPDGIVWWDDLGRSLVPANEVAGLSPTHARLCRRALDHGGTVSVLPYAVPDRVGELRQHRDGVCFGFAGRLVPQKRVNRIIEAFAVVRRHLASARFVVAGAGPEEQALRSLITRLDVEDSCELRQPYSGLMGRDAFLANIDVVVQPSSVEGTPHSIIEAMAHSLPVIATPVGGVPDLVSSRTGVLVPVDDSAALEQAMIELGMSPSRRTALGAEGRALYEAISAPHAVASLLDETYGRVAGVTRGHSGLSPAHPWRMLLA